MGRTIAAAFTAHPATVGESFGQHFLFAGRFGVMLVAAGCAALTHAVLPFLFQKTASNIIRSLVAEMDSRGRTGH